jgi:hypothetical protein
MRAARCGQSCRPHWASRGLETLEWVMRYILVVNDHVEDADLQALLIRAVGYEPTTSS